MASQQTQQVGAPNLGHTQRRSYSPMPRAEVAIAGQAALISFEKMSKAHRGSKPKMGHPCKKQHLLENPGSKFVGPRVAFHSFPLSAWPSGETRTATEAAMTPTWPVPQGPQRSSLSEGNAPLRETKGTGVLTLPEVSKGK